MTGDSLLGKSLEEHSRSLEDALLERLETVEEKSPPEPAPAAPPETASSTWEALGANLTLLQTVYHRYMQCGNDATALESNYGRVLKSDEQPYRREMKLTEKWQPLETGWLKGEVSLIVVKNLETTKGQVIPTPEEVAEVAERVIEIGFDLGVIEDNDDEPRTMFSPPQLPRVIVPFILVRPQLSTTFEPKDAASLALRCQKGQAKVLLVAFPK